MPPALTWATKATTWQYRRDGMRDRREFGSWTAALEEMAQWLKSCGIETVVMQSTGVYWIAVHDVLQRHGLEVNLVDARGTKSVPGRRVTYRNASGC